MTADQLIHLVVSDIGQVLPRLNLSLEPAMHPVDHVPSVAHHIDYGEIVP